MHFDKQTIVSVIVPVYRVKPYLDQCVRSIVEQSYRALQILLIDDGSPDECGQMCDEWALRDDRIRVIHKANGGLSDARNAGIAQATGEYLTFVDSDDWLEPDYISYLMQGITECDAQISVCGFFTVRNGQAQPWRKSDEAFVKMTALEAIEDMMYARRFDTSACAKLYHRSCFQQIRFPVGRLYEEVATTYRLLYTQRTVAVGMRPLYNYVKRPGSIVTAGFHARSMDMLRASREMLQFAQEKEPTLLAAAQRRMVYACCYLYKTMGSRWRSYPSETAELKTVMKQYRWSVLRDPKASRRDKAAILLLMPGISAFEKAWAVYCRLTGRERYEA